MNYLMEADVLVARFFVFGLEQKQSQGLFPSSSVEFIGVTHLTNIEYVPSFERRRTTAGSWRLKGIAS